MAEVLVDPSKCTVEGPGMTEAEFKKETSVIVSTVLPNGAPTEKPLKVTAELKSLVEGTASQLEGEQIEGNKYKFELFPRVRGRHELTINVNDQPIAGSPFPLFVKMVFGRLGSPEKIIGDLFYPYGVAINSANQVVVTEFRAITWYNKETHKKLYNIKITNDESHLCGLAIDEEENTYVVDRVWQRVLKYNKAGELLKSVGGKRGSGPCEFNEPTGVGLAGDNIIVCDKDNHRLQVLTKDGLEFVKAIGSRGEGDEDFIKPNGIAQDELGNLYVCDYGNNRVKVLNKEGEFQFSFSKRGNGQLKEPNGICIAGQFVYVTEKAKVSIFTKDGKFVSSFDNFNWPRGICVDQDGFIYVCEHGNNRIAIF